MARFISNILLIVLLCIVLIVLWLVVLSINGNDEAKFAIGLLLLFGAPAFLGPILIAYLVAVGLRSRHVTNSSPYENNGRDIFEGLVGFGIAALFIIEVGFLGLIQFQRHAIAGQFDEGSTQLAPAFGLDWIVASLSAGAILGVIALGLIVHGFRCFRSKPVQ